MPDSPQLTIAIPTCEGARHLREALVSIRTQKELPFDLLISDDRSQDETLTIVRELFGDQARISINSERLGLAGNWNRSVEISRTPWVSIFHQDDLMKEGHLASHRQVIESKEIDAIGMIAGRVAMIDDQGRPVPSNQVEPGGLGKISDSDRPIVFHHRTWGHHFESENPLRCSAVTLRKAALESVGGFDPALRYVVDWDCWWRISQRWGMAWCPGPPSVAMRWHFSSETHRFLTGTIDLEEQLQLIDRIQRSEGSRRSSHRLAHRRLARAFLNRSHTALKTGDLNLARTCLARAIELSPSILLTIAADPRLAIQMASLRWMPGQAGRWFQAND